MSKKNFPDITYYLYDYSNNLAKKPKKIYSPYNFKTLWRVPSEDFYRNPDSVEFIKWVYILKESNLWEKIYDEQKEWLGFYNMQGGQLTKWKWEAEYINWRRYKNDGIHIIKTVKVPTANEPIIQKITEKINIQQIPRIIAEGMNLPQLEKLALSWEIELPKDIRETGSAQDAMKKIIEIITEAGHISE